MPISSPALSQARDMQGLNTCRANRRRYLSQRKANPARPRDRLLKRATCLAAATPVLWNRWFLRHRAAVSLLRVAAFGRSAGAGGARRGGSRLNARRWSRAFSERTCHRRRGHSPLAHAADRHRRCEKEQSSSSNSHRLLPPSLGRTYLGGGFLCQCGASHARRPDLTDDERDGVLRFGARAPALPPCRPG